MYGFGHGSHFVAHLGVDQCKNCNNAARRQLYAVHTSQMVLGITEYSYLGATVTCPVCRHGASFEFPPFNSRLGKLFGGAEAKRKRGEALQTLTSLLAEADLPSTRLYLEKLGWLERRRYRAMLEQLQLNDFALALVHG